jgi:hypothetical protein
VGKAKRAHHDLPLSLSLPIASFVKERSAAQPVQLGDLSNARRVRRCRHRPFQAGINRKSCPRSWGRRSAARLGEQNQFGAEIDHMAECILTGRAPRTPGAEGLQDHRIMEAIYRSAAENRPVSLQAIAGRDVFRGPGLDDEN